MMETEEESRVSLEDTFDEEIPPPVKPINVSRARAQASRAAKKPPSPLFPPATWETAATSWLLPDALQLVWRLGMFAAALAATIVFLNARPLRAVRAAVALVALGTTTLGALPSVLRMLYGPHEDTLSARPLPVLYKTAATLTQFTTSNLVHFVLYTPLTTAEPLFIALAGLLTADLFLSNTTTSPLTALLAPIPLVLYLAILRSDRLEIVRAYLGLSAVCAGVVLAQRARAWWVRWLEGRRDEEFEW